MILRIARKELTETLRDGRFRWAATIVFALLLASLLVGWKHYRDVETQRSISQQSDRDLWENQGEKNQHSAAHFGAYAFKPTLSLALVDQGVLPYTGVSVFMEAHSVKDAAFRPAEDATAAQRLGSLTAASTLQLLIPFILILLSFSAFAGERERGTLRQLLSLGVRPRTLATGKALGLAAPLALIVIPATIIGVLAIALLSGDSGAIWSGARVAMLVGIYLLYFAIILGVCLVTSATARSSRSALVILLGFWLTTSFIAPRVATDIADAAHPIPSPIEFEADVDAAMDELPGWYDRVSAIESRLMAEHGVDTAEEIPASVAGYALLEAERDETDVRRTQLARLDALYGAQSTVTQATSFFSPLLAVQLLSMGMAGSDYPHHQHFVRAAETYRYDLVQTLNQDMVDVNASWDYTAGADFWSSLPPFSYTSPDAKWAAGHYRLAMLALGFWFLLTLVVGGVTLGRTTSV